MSRAIQSVANVHVPGEVPGSIDLSRKAGLDVPRTLVSNREKRLKGPHSRFANERALELWGGESAAYQLSYRWYQVQRIVIAKNYLKELKQLNG